MSESTDSNFPRVAIIGGGITGVMLALGLRLRNIPFVVYERAAGFSETGAGIGISPNAEKAMGLIDPKVLAAYLETVTPNGEDYFQWIDGHTTDKLIGRLYLGKDGFQGGRRSDFLKSWSSLIPKETVQFRKELVGVDETKVESGNTIVTLRFADGTTATADVVIACDGVWSRVRSLVFGDAYRATYTGQYCFRAVVPMDEAQKAMGTYRTSTRFMFNGPNTHAITYPVAKNTMLNVLVVVSEKEDPENKQKIHEAPSSPQNNTPTTPSSRALAEEALADWQPCARSIATLFPPNPDRWDIYDMLANPVPQYNRGLIALAGDAAHAAGPHLGSGAGFGIEDALVLSEVLALAAEASKGKKNTAEVLQTALAIYSDVRYERTQWLIKNTRDALVLFQWKDPDHARDDDYFLAEITKRFHHIWHYEGATMVEETRRAFSERVQKEKSNI